MLGTAAFAQKFERLGFGEHIRPDSLWTSVSACEHYLSTLSPPPERRKAFEKKHSKVRRNWVLPDGFPSRAVTDAYLKPVVDSSEAPLSWARPNLHGLREFCADKFGWVQAKVRTV